MGALTRLRPFDDVASELRRGEPLAVISCNNCVRVSGAGGEGVWEGFCRELKRRGFLVEQEVLVTNPCSRGYLEDLRVEPAVKTVVLLACAGARAGLATLHPDLNIVEATETLGLFVASKADGVIKLAMAFPEYAELQGREFKFGDTQTLLSTQILSQPEEARP